MSARDVRLSRVLGPGRSLMVAIDDAFISGPRNMQATPLTLASEAARVADSVLAFAGLMDRLTDLRVGRVVNLTASTTRSRHVDKVHVSSVSDAIRAGADAVAVHVNMTADAEAMMWQTLGNVVHQSSQYAIPVLAIVYPRKASETPSSEENYEVLRVKDPDAYTDLVAHAVAAAVSLGADIVKTQYPGSAESMRYVVDEADGIPLLVAGGPLLAEDEYLRIVRTAIAAGARGVSVGRNFFSRPDRLDFVDRLRTQLLEPTNER